MELERMEPGMSPDGDVAGVGVSDDEMMAMDEATMAEEYLDADPAEDLPPDDEITSMAVAPIQLVPVPMGMVDPSALEPHPYADILPRMRDRKFTELQESIELDGLQNPIVIYQGKILDGRHRWEACLKLGLSVTVVEFVGTEQQALTYVLSSNQHRRDMTPSQRGVVALELMPRVSEDVNRKRIEKIRQARLAASPKETLAISPESEGEPASPITARAIAASMMGVGDNYVGQAKRIRDASPELLEEVRAGRVTIPEAIRQLEGISDDPRTIRAKTVRRQVGKLLGDPDDNPDFLDRLEALVAEFMGD